MYVYNNAKDDSGVEICKRGINKLTEVINSCPKDAGLFFNRATLKVHIGDIKGARSDFKKSEYIHLNLNH